jgi:hypothetical protein
VTVTEQDVLRIAAEAVCDPRTVRRVLAGEFCMSCSIKIGQVAGVQRK